MGALLLVFGWKVGAAGLRGAMVRLCGKRWQKSKGNWRGEARGMRCRGQQLLRQRFKCSSIAAGVDVWALSHHSCWPGLGVM